MQIINTALDNCNYISYSRYAVGYEIKHGIISTVKKIADKEKILVDLEWTAYDRNISVASSRKLLELCSRVCNGELSIQWGVSEFIEVCRCLCKKIDDQSFMRNLIDSKFLSNLEPDYAQQLFYLAVEYKDVNALSKLVAAKVKLSVNSVLSSIELLFRDNKEITRLAIKLIDKNTELSHKSVQRVAKCGNEYLINYVIDMGYGEDLLACCEEYGSYADYQTAIKVLKENGFEIPDTSDYIKSVDVAYRQNIAKLIGAIEEDKWNRNLEEFVNNNPEALLDTRVTKAIENNNTITSRQLQRKIANNPKNGPVYDF